MTTTTDSTPTKIDAIARAFEDALALSEGAASGDSELSEAAALVRQALGLVKSRRSRIGRGKPSVASAPTVESTILETMLPHAVPEEMPLPPAWGEDPEEREARELAALRAQFAAGAAEEDEQLDWSIADGGGGSDDEGDFTAYGAGGDDGGAAARLLLDSLDLPPPEAEAEAVVRSWEDLEGFVPQGTPGFNDFAREQMRLAGVPSNACVKPPDELTPAEWVIGPEKPRLQPYQETVAYLCRPQSLRNPRMLVVHRTGCGKTATMIRIADDYFSDRRPKVLIFPTNAVCNSFYRELRNPHFPNRYAAYLRRGGFTDARKALELSGILRNGAVAREFVEHPELPSAPLRAFSYTQAGGAASCGARPNAVFKCPDGYSGSYPERLPRNGGYDDFSNGACNPFSNKIVLMDEVHNLVRPSAEILRNPRRMLMLQRLRQLLRTAENSVIVGLSGTPLCDVPAEAEALMGLVKGRRGKELSDEGFVSYYMDTPPSVFPRLTPAGLPRALPAASLRLVPLRNLPMSVVERRRRGREGNRRQYEAKVADELSRLGGGGGQVEAIGGDDCAEDAAGAVSLRSVDLIKLGCISRLCAVAQTFSYAGRDDVSRVVHGEGGRLLKRDVAEAECGGDAQRQRARGYASKLARIVEDVAAAPAELRTLVLVHRYAGYKLLLRMAAKKFGADAVRGYPAARTAAERADATLLPLLGAPHDEAAEPSDPCRCALCAFNRGGAGAPRIMIADAKECGEGVSFFGVRRLLLGDVPSSADELTQRIGRAVRFMGHASLPEAERHVEMRLYVATAKGGAPTADELLVERLAADLVGYGPELQRLKAKAVDAGMWDACEPCADEEQGDDANADGADADDEAMEEVKAGQEAVQEEQQEEKRGEECALGSEAFKALQAKGLKDALHVEEALSESDDDDAAAADEAEEEAALDTRSPEEIFLALQPKKLKVAELKQVLGGRGLKTSGRKDELIARVEAAIAAAIEATPLPAGWKAAQAADGSTYYYDRATKVTQWTRPMAPTEAAMAAAAETTTEEEPSSVEAETAPAEATSASPSQPQPQRPVTPEAAAEAASPAGAEEHGVDGLEEAVAALQIGDEPSAEGKTRAEMEAEIMLESHMDTPRAQPKDGGGGVGDKENAVQRSPKRPGRSPLASPGAGVGRASPAAQLPSPGFALEPPPPPASAPPAEEAPGKAAPPKKKAAAPAAAKSDSDGAPRPKPKGGKRPGFVAFSRDAARSGDEDSGSDMDDFIAGSAEESDGETSESSGSWDGSGSDDADDAEGDAQSSDASGSGSDDDDGEDAEVVKQDKERRKSTQAETAADGSGLSPTTLEWHQRQEAAAQSTPDGAAVASPPPAGWGRLRKKQMASNADAYEFDDLDELGDV